MRFSVVIKIVTAMLAFAANSIICRVALRGGHIDPVTFTDLRLTSGALVLLPLLIRHKEKLRGSLNLKNALFLMAYAMCFSVAYIHLDTGTGALLLFGVVQLTMVVHGVLAGELLTMLRTTGLVVAAGGIGALLLPGAKAPPVSSALIMGLAGLAWAAYTLAGRNQSGGAVATAGNFLIAVPLALILTPFISSGLHSDVQGVILAVVAGAAASAGAYVLWYSLLPHLDSVTASTVQLSVPCLAMLGGVLFLGESLSLRMLLSTVAVLAGIVLVIGAPRRKR